MSVRFDIQHYAGALAISFGMTRVQGHRLLGSPESNHPILEGSGMFEDSNAARYKASGAGGRPGRGGRMDFTSYLFSP